MTSLSPAESSPPIKQVNYIRARDNPFFDGMRRGEASVRTRASYFGYPGKIRQKIFRSASDIGNSDPQKILAGVSETRYSPSIDSPSPSPAPSGIIAKSFGRSSSENLSKTSKTTSYLAENNLSGSKDNKLTNVDVPRKYEENGKSDMAATLVKPALERSYSVTKNTLNFTQIPISRSAASFYNGYSPQLEVVDSCESINRLNLYMKARKEDIKAGVPGKFLHAVMGQDVSGVGSFVSTILYAFYLNETLQSNQFCTVPVINMKREDLNTHAELKWLLESCSINESSLVFLDEIDLSYYDLYGSLKLVLLNSNKLPYKQEALMESVVDTFNCRKDDVEYPFVDTMSVAQECSSCALVAELYALTSPETMASKGFSRLLLAGILLDTRNLASPHCSTKDMYMATLLINGAGRFGCSGLYHMLKYKMHDVSDLKVGDILRNDFKKWTRMGNTDSSGPRLKVSHVGMTSVGISVTQLLAHDVASTHEILQFLKIEKLRLLVIVSGYYDQKKDLKRDILVSAKSTGLMTHLLHFFESHDSYIPLSDMHQPGLRDNIRAFKVGKVISKRTIERLLEEFTDTL